MAINKLLVPLETIKANSLIEQNAEPEKLRQAVLESQRVECRSMMGARLQDLFLNAIDDNGTLTGLTSIQSTFYTDYLVPMLSKYAEATFIMTAHYQISNVGVQHTTTEHTTPASDKAVYDLHKRAKNAADYFAQRAKTFILLEENKTDLGDYYYADEQNITPQKNVHSGSVYTPYRSGGNC